MLVGHISLKQVVSELIMCSALEWVLAKQHQLVGLFGKSPVVSVDTSLKQVVSNLRTSQTCTHHSRGLHSSNGESKASQRAKQSSATH